jgi:LacI family transcriptional regulator
MSSESRVTQSHIAKRLGVSISTVSRALQGHPGYNQATTELVVTTAKQMGYVPNLTARHLVSNRRVRVAVITPQEIASVYSHVRQGIQDEALPFLSMAVEVLPYSFARLGMGEAAAFKKALDENVTGVIIVPGDLPHLKASFRRAAESKVQVVCLLSEAPASTKLATVAVNAHSCGALAGEILSRSLPLDRVGIAISTGDLRVTDHSQKVLSFTKAVEAVRPGTPIYAPIENHESEKEAHDRTLAFLKRHKNLAALYIGTGNALPVLDAVKACGLLGKIAIVATNVFPELIPLIRNGDVLAAIFERPYSHGRIAMRLLCDYLVSGVKPPERISLEPLLVMRSNLEAFTSLETEGLLATALL